MERKNILSLYSPAKINLLLHITNKRKDGYHNIQTIMQSINLHDTISIEETKKDRIEVICTSPYKKNRNNVAIKEKENTAFKAAELLKKKFKIKHGVRIKIIKKIPVGSGLGGGSSNAAAVLAGLNKMWNLDLGIKELKKIGVLIGADVPFFIKGGTALATGIGEKLKKLQSPKLWFILANPMIPISTREIYNKWDKIKNLKLTRKTEYIKITLHYIKNGNVKKLPEHIFNDLEKVVVRKYPVIEKLKDALVKAGCENAIMTGSGSTVYGITFSQQKATKIYRQMAKKTGWIYLAKALPEYATLEV